MICDRVMARNKYIAAMVKNISNTRNVSEAISLACMVISYMAMTLTRDESLIRETAWLVKGGSIRLMAWGRII